MTFLPVTSHTPSQRFVHSILSGAHQRLGQTEANPYNSLCPICGRPANSADRCIPGSYYCVNGHQWTPSQSRLGQLDPADKAFELAQEGLPQPVKEIQPPTNRDQVCVLMAQAQEDIAALERISKKLVTGELVLTADQTVAIESLYAEFVTLADVVLQLNRACNAADFKLPSLSQDKLNLLSRLHMAVLEVEPKTTTMPVVAVAVGSGVAIALLLKVFGIF